MLNSLTFREDFQTVYKSVLDNDNAYYTDFDNFLYKVCIKLFSELPSKFKLTEYPTYGKSKDTETQNGINYVDLSVEEIQKYKNLFADNTYNKCKKYLEDNNIQFLEYRYDRGAYIITVNEECIFNYYDDIYVYSHGLYAPQWIIDNTVFPEQSKFSYQYLVFDPDCGFTMFPMKISKQEIDIETNYNDDLPDTEIKDFLTSEESGLVILHGLAGTGKTTYIRHLITSLEKRFIYLDQLAFNNITDMSFIRLMSQYSNSVIIVEDCEVLLSERERGNASISSLLNLTDGILGDSFKFKIICTFNSDLTKLDKALLRKGRLKVKYDFNYLTEDKVKKLSDKLGIDIDTEKNKKLTLSEVYNFKEKVDYVNKKEKRIGF